MREEPWAKIIICGDKYSESQELSSENIFCQIYVLLNSQVVKKLSSLYEYLVVVNVWFTAVRVFFDQWTGGVYYKHRTLITKNISVKYTYI